MKKFFSKISVMIIIVMMCVSLLPSMRYQVAAHTQPPIFSEVQIRAKMNTLIRKLSNRYFTTNQRPAGDVSETCEAAQVTSSEWLIELVNDGNYSTFEVVNFPCQYYTSASGMVYKGGYSGYSCWGFANFAEYYLYSSCYTDNLTGELIYSGYASMEAIRQYARTGDIIRFGSSAGHSVIFYSIVDESTILALDSNWYDDCMVTFGERGLNTLSRSGSRMMTITRASNYEHTEPSAPQSPSDESEENDSSENDVEHGSEEGNVQTPSDTDADISNKMDIIVGDYIEVTSNGLNVRSWSSSSSSVMTVLPNRAQVRVESLSEDGYWAEVSYNGVTGWIFLNYVKKIEVPTESFPFEPEFTPDSEDKPSSEIPEDVKPVIRLVEVTAAGLNCREGSSTSYKVVQILTKGTRVEITEVSDNGLWGKCEYAGKTGWISLNYTKTIEVRVPETSQPETSKPETSQPETSKPEASQPETSKPEASQPETSKPETSQPEASKPETSKPETSQPETSKPETSQPETSKPEEKPSSGKLVVVTGNWLNVRKGPHTDYEKIGELSKGDQVLILEITEDGGWGRFLMNGKDAWIFLYYTKEIAVETSKPEASEPETSQPETSKPETSKPEISQPETSQPEISQPEYDVLPYNAVHHVTATLGLNMRVAPGADSLIIYGVPYMYDVTVIEITKDGIWGKTTLDGYTGWINLQYTKKVEDTPAQIPSQSETKPQSDFRLVTATLGLNMRQEPSVDSKVIYGVPYTYKVLITEVSSDGNWGKTTLDGYTGWINLNYTQVIVSFSESSNQDYMTYPTLTIGSTGKYVEILQSRLMELGYDCSGIDGSFGNMTYNQVVRFQSVRNLKADGIVEKETWNALYN